MHLSTDEEIRATISMTAAVAAVRQALRDFGAGQFDLPPRVHHANGAYLVMSAFNSRSDSTVVKSLSIDARRTPAIIGATTWTSVGSSEVVVADAASITAMRTGAIVGVATDVLAVPEASRLVLYGAGALAGDQVRAVHSVRPLTELTIVSPTGGRAQALAGDLAAELPGVAISVCRLGGEDLSRVQVICCATPATAPLFSLADLPDVVHVNAVGSYRPQMRELPDELVEAAAVVAVDDRESCVSEAGEVIRALERGMAVTRLTPLHELLEKTTVLQRGGRTVIKSVGLAVQDWALMELLARSLEARAGRPTSAHPPAPPA